jgi:hypothetical protein
MAAIRCAVCRREIGAGSICSDPMECEAIRASWEPSPCPVARCEFAASEHTALQMVDGSIMWTCPDGWETLTPGPEMTEL